MTQLRRSSCAAFRATNVVVLFSVLLSPDTGRGLLRSDLPSMGAAAPARRYFVASNAERTASTRLRLTPRSPRPTREAERTWITFAAGSYQNSTSSTYFISLVVNCAYR